MTGEDPMYCRQFIIGQEYIEGLKGWEYLAVNKRLKITAHPELEIQQVKNAESSLTLIGHLFDTDDPGATNQQILKKLMAAFTNINTLIESCDSYGGRWLILAVKVDDDYIFGDALGLRQLFYTNTTSGRPIWLFSQAGLAKKLLDLETDAATQAFIDSPQFRSDPEYSWPAGATPFSQLSHLLPNHCLHINTRRHYRYWPVRSIETIDFESATRELSRRFQNTMDGIVNRFDNVAIGITAGLDSRLVLAASRKWRHDISYVTVKQNSLEDAHQDITVPHRLLGKLGLPHRIVHAKEAMSTEFAALFRENVFLAHEHYGPDAEALMNSYQRNTVAITGSGAEVGRCPYPWAPRNRIMTAEQLAALDHKSGSEYAINQFRRWLSSIEDTCNMNRLDLFSWENGHGNWLAMTQLEFDIAWQEIITPYNCRKILTTMLSVKEKYRERPDFRLANALLRKMWPEVLCEPINPADRQRKSFVDHIKRVIRKTTSVFV